MNGLIKWMGGHTPQTDRGHTMCHTSVLPPPGGRNWNYHAPYSEQSGESLAISLFYPSSAFSLTSGGRKWSLTSFSFTEGNSYISPHWQSSGTFGSLRPGQMFPGTDNTTWRRDINSYQHNPRSGFKTGEPSIENRKNNYKRLSPLLLSSLLVVQVKIVIFSLEENIQSRKTKYAGGYMQLWSVH